jgi:hypothetical protein
MNIILTPSSDWAISSHIYKSQIKSVCKGQDSLLQEDSVLWDMTQCHRALISCQFDEMCLSSGVQNAANIRVLSDWFKVMLCNRKHDLGTPVNTLFSFLSSVLRNPLAVVLCFIPFIR